MAWMETYIFYCSVRLGVIVVAVLSFFQLFIPAIFFLCLGIKVLDPIVNLFENDDHYKKNQVIIKLNDWIENYSQNFMIAINVYLFLHMATCILALLAAIKLWKWFLMPFIIFEFVRVIYCLTWHIVLMIMLKKILNLGVLITFTLAGGFLMLYLGYNWATSVALFQIIQLVHCERYRKLYGNDPYHPILIPTAQLLYNDEYNNNLSSAGYGTIENVRVLVTPNDDIDEQKQRFAKVTKSKNFKQSKQQPIISVIPVDYENNSDRIAIVGAVAGGASNAARRQQREQQLIEAQRNEYNNNNNYNADYSVDYGNWQWMEVMGGGVAKKRGQLIGSGNNW